MYQMLKNLLVAVVGCTIIAFVFSKLGTVSSFAFFWGFLMVITVPLVVTVTLTKTYPLIGIILTVVVLAVVIYNVWPALALYRARLIGPKTEYAIAEQRLDLDQRRFDALHPTGREMREDLSAHAREREATITNWAREELRKIRNQQAEGEITEAEAEQLEQKVRRDKEANLAQVQKLTRVDMDQAAEENLPSTPLARRIRRFLRTFFWPAIVLVLALALFPFGNKTEKKDEKKSGRRATDQPVQQPASAPAPATATTTTTVAAPRTR